jgi:peptidoglycan-associated lipoprotein
MKIDSKILLLLMLFIVSCSASKRLKRANKAYDIGEYYTAIGKYKKLYRKTKQDAKKAEIQFKIGKAYKYIGDYNRAESYLRNAIRRDYPDAEVMLLYAEVLRANEEYENAIASYELYLDFFPDNILAQNGLESCNKTIEWSEDPTRFKIQNLKKINSRGSDFAAIYHKGNENVIYLTSSRKGSTGKRESPITGQLYSDIYKATYDKQKGKWPKPVLIDEELLINTGSDEGVSSFNSRGTNMYFTRCRYDKERAMGAEIYSATISAGQWSEPVREELVGDSLLAAHPSLSADGNTLYFVSDMPGGFGGKDIWKVEGGSGVWKNPVNLGPKINTPGDEMFPFIRDNGELYFSSNYHVGMGGFDIFKSYKNENEELIVENMQSPVNSTGDDFSIFFIPGEDKGLFSSNRDGARGDDIFSFILPPIIFRIDGVVYDSETGDRMNNAMVRLIGTDGTMLRQTAENGSFKFNINPESEYVVAAYKEGFLNAKVLEETIGLKDSKTFSVKLELTPVDEPIHVDNIYFETGRWQLLPESVSALDSLYEVLSINPTIKIELMAHTDNRGALGFNSELSQKRAQSVVNYLMSKGIAYDRLIAKGYGETAPKTITKKIAKEYSFLNDGDELTFEFIDQLRDNEQREICHQINRRTEFRVISTDYKEKFSSR